ARAWVGWQPMWVPVSRSPSRIKWTSRSRGSTSASRISPLIETWTSIRSSPPAGAFQRRSKRPPRQNPHQVPLVLRGPAQIVGRLGRRGGELGGAPDRGLVHPLSSQRILGALGLDRRRPDAREADPGASAGPVRAERQLDGDGGRREVADLALELHVGAAAPRRRHGDADLGEDLAGSERRRERAGEE